MGLLEPSPAACAVVIRQLLPPLVAILPEEPHVVEQEQGSP